MTGVEIVVGGTCRNQCNTDGRPLAAYGIVIILIGGRPTATPLREDPVGRGDDAAGMSA